MYILYIHVYYLSSRKNHEKSITYHSDWQFLSKFLLPFVCSCQIQRKLPLPAVITSDRVRPRLFRNSSSKSNSKNPPAVSCQVGTPAKQPRPSDLQPSTPENLRREIRWDPSMEKQHRPQSGHPANLRQAGKIKLFLLQSRCHWKCGCLISLKHTDFMQPCILKTSKKSAQLEWRVEQKAHKTG